MLTRKEPWALVWVGGAAQLYVILSKQFFESEAIQMNADPYVATILNKYGPDLPLLMYVQSAIVTPLSNAIHAAFRVGISSIKLSGSFAKGTSVKGGTDVDLFVSFLSSVVAPLRDIYQDVFDFAQAIGLAPKKQNVSICIQYGGYSVDLVPGRRQPDSIDYHWIFRRRVGTWMQTNIDKQITYVKSSGRANDIRLCKIWRNLNNIDLPSALLELSVIEALRANRSLSPADRFVSVLRYLSELLPTARLVDVSNGNNVISDELNQTEKKAIAAAAKRSLESEWEKVVW
jgi:hypothetical protein